MGFIQLLVSLWPFLKEMLFGEKIKETNASEESGARKAQRKHPGPSRFAFGVLNKLQDSRRILGIFLIILVASLALNYRLSVKVMSVMSRPDEHQAPHTPPSAQQKEHPTEPHDRNKAERDALYEQTVNELHDLYGDLRK